MDLFDSMRKVFNEAHLINQYGEVSEAQIQTAVNELGLEGYSFNRVSPGKQVGYIDREDISTGLNTLFYFDRENEIWLQHLSGDKVSLHDSWNRLSPEFRRSDIGMGRDGIIYIKWDSVENSELNMLFRGSKKSILSIGSALPFTYHGLFENVPGDQQRFIINKLTKITRVVASVADKSVLPKYLIYKWGDEPLSAEERIYGFTHFWSEVKYNFAFFDQVPDLDWDAVYRNYLPIIMADQTNASYFRTLQEICALLKDGHTNIYLPPIGIHPDTPPIRLKNIAGKAIVENIAEQYAADLPRGSEITFVDNVPVSEYLDQIILPFISSSTTHILLNNGVRRLLEGASGQDVILQFKRPDETSSSIVLPRNRNSTKVDWYYEWPERGDRLKFTIFDQDIAYIALHSFSDERIMSDFEDLIDTLSSYDKIILDLRKNGGGNSTIGYNILKYFTDKPFVTSRWQTREHKAAFKAWGAFYKNKPVDSLDDWEWEAVKTWEGDYWHIGPPDTIQPNKKVEFTGNLIVLIGNNTASAAEDFLIALDGLKMATLVGEPTYGSTGQPLQFELPRGGQARICTKKDTYPDGREFVGYGVQPDILIAPDVHDFIEGRDVVLKRALNELK